MLALAALLTACDGGGGKVTPSPSPSVDPGPGIAGSPTPTPQPPHAAELEFGTGTKELYQDDTEIPIAAAATYGFDNLALAGKRGVRAPPCPAFAFLLSWQVRQPYPPEGVDLRIETLSMDSPTEIASGASGNVSVGCTYVQIVNNSDVDVAVEMRYGFGEVLP
jgi:hypothetical protein